MDTNKKKLSLREKYEAAMKGEHYKGSASALREAIGSAHNMSAAVAFIPVIAIFATLYGVMSFVDVDRRVEMIAPAIVLGAIVWTVAFIVDSRKRSKAPMLELRALNNCSVDQDGVSRTKEERTFLKSPFATAYVLVSTTRSMLIRVVQDNGIANALTTDRTGTIEVGGALLRAERKLALLENALETLWQNGANEDELLSLHCGTVCGEALQEIAGSCSFIYHWALKPS